MPILILDVEQKSKDMCVVTINKPVLYQCINTYKCRDENILVLLFYESFWKSPKKCFQKVLGQKVYQNRVYFYPFAPTQGKLLPRLFICLLGKTTT